MSCFLPKNANFQTQFLKEVFLRFQQLDLVPAGFFRYKKRLLSPIAVLHFYISFFYKPPLRPGARVFVFLFLFLFPPIAIAIYHTSIYAPITLCVNAFLALRPKNAPKPENTQNTHLVRPLAPIS
jgi:hypothetical protein